MLQTIKHTIQGEINYHIDEIYTLEEEIQTEQFKGDEAAAKMNDSHKE